MFAPVVGGSQQDGVGAVSGFNGGGDSSGNRHPDQRSVEISGCVHGFRAEGTRSLSDVVAVTGVHGRNGVGEITGFG